MRAAGAEINAFYQDWPPGPDWCHDGGDAEPLDDGTLKLDPAAKYDLSATIGYLDWNGPLGADRDFIIYKGKRFISCSDNILVSLFKAWRENTVAVLVQLPPDQVDQLKALAKERGWKTR